MIPVIIVCGFLGSGKTTLMEKLLIRCGEKNITPALIINEIGGYSIDSELLKKSYEKPINLIGGCICCTMQEGLVKTAKELTENSNYDLILIECSGLSDPVDVVSALAGDELTGTIKIAHTVCVIAAHKADMIMQISDFARHQVLFSDIVVLNKTDLVEDLPLSFINQLNENTELFLASYGNIGNENIDKIVLTENNFNTHTDHHCCHHHGENENINHQHEHRDRLESFCTFSVELSGKSEKGLIDKKLREVLGKNIYRIKGFFKYLYNQYIVQSTMQDIYITETDIEPGNCQNRLVFIGRDYDKKYILDKLRDL